MCEWERERVRWVKERQFSPSFFTFYTTVNLFLFLFIYIHLCVCVYDSHFDCVILIARDMIQATWRLFRLDNERIELLTISIPLYKRPANQTWQRNNLLLRHLCEEYFSQDRMILYSYKCVNIGVPIYVPRSMVKYRLMCMRTYIGRMCYLFNGISTFRGYLMPNPSFQEASIGAI